MKGELHILSCLLYLCDFSFVLLLCSLQGFKVVSGAVVIHKLPSSLRYTRLQKMEKRVMTIFPGSQNHRDCQQHPRLSSTQLIQHCMLCLHRDTHWTPHTGCPERTFPIFHLASPKPLLFRFPKGCSKSLASQLTALVHAETQKKNTRKCLCCQHSRSTPPHAQDMPRTAFQTLQPEIQTEALCLSAGVTTVTANGPLQPATMQEKREGEAVALYHRYTTSPFCPKLLQRQGRSQLRTRLTLRKRILTGPWVRIQTSEHHGCGLLLCDTSVIPLSWGALRPSRPPVSPHWGSDPLGSLVLSTTNPPETLASCAFYRHPGRSGLEHRSSQAQRGLVQCQWSAA